MIRFGVISKLVERHAGAVQSLLTALLVLILKKLIKLFGVSDVSSLAVIVFPFTEAVCAGENGVEISGLRVNPSMGRVLSLCALLSRHNHYNRVLQIGERNETVTKRIENVKSGLIF